RAYRAFECYRNLPSGERTLIAAYRQYVGNLDAAKPSDTWSRWSSQFAWRERAAAYDAHIDLLREKSIERVIQQQAEEQARQAERMRGRYNELMTIAYMEAMEYLESGDFAQQMRPQDVISIIKLHLEDVEKQGGFNPPEQDTDLTEEELAELDRITGEIDAEEAQDEPEKSSEEGDDSDESQPDDMESQHE
ncbi:MAG: hypothetical protein M3122_10060, partial [Actinomycetota bacterium]|nr:hypothetical protein [Actinomycetota bacterium]